MGAFASPLALIIASVSYGHEGLRSLKEDGIRRHVVNREVGPSLVLNNLPVMYLERFYADGRWIASRQDRGSSQYRGSWSIKNDRICVMIKDGSLSCRTLWYDSKVKSFLMEDFLHPENGQVLYITARRF